MYSVLMHTTFYQGFQEQPRVFVQELVSQENTRGQCVWPRITTRDTNVTLGNLLPLLSPDVLLWTRKGLPLPWISRLAL